MTADPVLASLFDLMGRGWRLRIPKDGSQATLEWMSSRLDPYFASVGKERIEVSADDARTIAGGGHRHFKRSPKDDFVATHGNNGGISVWAEPYREVGGGGRPGWRDLGWDGQYADWYSLGY